jgi:hypothetical protein
MKHFSKLPVIIFCYASNLRASLEASGRLAQGREVPATISADTLLPGYCSLRPPLPPVVIWRARGKAKGSDGEAEQFVDLSRRLDGVVARRVSWKRRRSSSVVSLRLTCVAPGAARGSRVRILELGKSCPEDNPRVGLLTLVAWALQTLRILSRV